MIAASGRKRPNRPPGVLPQVRPMHEKEDLKGARPLPEHGHSTRHRGCQPGTL